jgi:hypothetical protein
MIIFRYARPGVSGMTMRHDALPECPVPSSMQTLFGHDWHALLCPQQHQLKFFKNDFFLKAKDFPFSLIKGKF